MSRGIRALESLNRDNLYCTGMAHPNLNLKIPLSFTLFTVVSLLLWRPAVTAQGRDGFQVEDAAWIFIIHDLNPRALSPRVKGFVQAQSWYQDLTLPWVEK